LQKDVSEQRNTVNNKKPWFETNAWF